MASTINSFFSRRRFVLFLSLAIFTFAATSATLIKYNADFKGEWNFNEKKSKLAEGRFRMNASKLQITGDGEGLAIERTVASPNGETMVSPEKITFDGKPSQSTAFGTAKKSSTATWSADGQSMTINATTLFEFNGNSMEIKSVEVWKLIEDGKALSIDSKTTSERGTTEATFVYDKK